eukprot:TRINITY_DN13490_c0_g1_i1.p1 TRINITY_DN13490_c0_g1~~TRINITY_DN13490_c0_g1_i1.p1  ORF type:complete len:788 (-),score=168.09 TRINITY_DN13490_c0_g1_i1:462-2825(-)
MVAGKAASARAAATQDASPMTTTGTLTDTAQSTLLPPDDAYGARGVIPLNDKVLQSLRTVLRQRLEDNIDGKNRVRDETYDEFWKRMDLHDTGFLSDGEFISMIRIDLAIRNGEVSDVQIMALAHEFDHEDIGSVDLSAFRDFLWREQDAIPVAAEERQRYRASHMMRPLQVECLGDPPPVLTKVLLNPNATAGSRVIMREQRKLQKESLLAGVSYSKLLELQQRMRKHLLKFCNRDNILRKWRNANGFRLLCAALAGRDPHGEDLGALRFRAMTRRLREHTCLSIGDFSDDDLNAIYRALDAIDGEVNNQVEMKDFLTFVQMPLMSLKHTQAMLKSFAVARCGADWPIAFEMYRTLLPGYVTFEDLLGYVRNLLKITLKVMPDWEVRLFYDTFNHREAAAVTLADLVEFISDGQLVFAHKPHPLPSREDLDKPIDASMADELRKSMRCTPEEAQKLLQGLTSMHMSDWAEQQTSMKHLLKTMASHGHEQRRFSSEGGGFMNTRIFEEECQREERYAEALEKGIPFSRGKSQKTAERRRQDEESLAQELFDNPPWLRFRKRSSSFDERTQDDSTPSASSMSRRSLTPPPNSDRRADLQKPWEKVASPVVRRSSRSTGPRTRSGSKSTTYGPPGDVSRRDSRSGASHPAGHKSADPAGRHHVPNCNWHDSMPYAGKVSLLNFPAAHTKPREAFADSADFELQKKAITGYAGHLAGTHKVIARGYSERKLAAVGQSPPRAKGDWSNWDWDKMANSYGRPPPRNQHGTRKPTEYKGPIPAWFQVHPEVHL